MITALKAEVKTRALNFRNLDRLMAAPEFAEAYKLDPENIWIKFAIANGNVDEVKAWIEDTLITEVGEMNMRQLRKRAAQLDIIRYTMYSKDELIVRIINAQRAKESVVGVPLQGQHRQDVSQR